MTDCWLPKTSLKYPKLLLKDLEKIRKAKKALCPTPYNWFAIITRKYGIKSWKHEIINGLGPRKFCLQTNSYFLGKLKLRKLGSRTIVNKRNIELENKQDLENQPRWFVRMKMTRGIDRNRETDLLRQAG